MENNRTFNEIYDEIVNDLKGKLTSEEYKELISLEYVLTWGYNEPGDFERYDELRNKKYE
jgi:hypothetical protein